MTSLRRALLLVVPLVFLQVTDAIADDPPPLPEDWAEEQATKARWGVGARGRYFFIPTAVLNLFMDHSTALNTFSVGAEVVRSKGDLDIVFSLDYSDGSPPDGLYLEQGDDPAVFGQYPDYTEFDGLALLSVDASFIWHANITKQIQFRYGAGLGIGVVLGTIYQTDTMCPPGTTADNLDNENFCTRVPGTRHESDDVPPVLPVVNVLLGFRFKLADQVAINLEGGFRDGFFVGLGTTYVFK
jgi:hypothetical protein